MTDSIALRFDVVCRNYPDRVALFDGAGRPITFEQFFYSVHSLAQALLEHGVRPGQIIAIHVSEPPVRMALMLAALRLGIKVAVYGLSIPEPGRASRIPFHVVDPDAPVAEDPRILRLDATWLRQAEQPAPQRRSGGIIVATSGTTGTSKLLGISDNVILARLDLDSRTFGQRAAPIVIGYSASTSIGFRYFLTALFLGQPQLRIHQDPALTIAKMAELGVCFGGMPPASLRVLVNGAKNYTGTLPVLKEIRVGGGAISLGLAEEAERLFGGEVRTLYGTTETGNVSVFRRVDVRDTNGVVGKIMPQLDHKFIGDDGATSATGELCIRVPEAIRASSYLNGEAGPYDAEGWVATGDIGHIRSDGNLELTGRKSEFINSGGTKREPAYFEHFAHRIAGVTEAAAFSLPNDWGSEDVGLLLLVKTPTPEDFVLRNAFHECIERGFTIKIFFVETIPYTEAGKVSRRQLADAYRDEVADVTLI